MIQIAEYLPPQPNALWKLARQAGVNHAVGQLPRAEEDGEQPWEIGPLNRMKTRFEEARYTLSVIESSPPMQQIRLGLPGRDERGVSCRRITCRRTPWLPPGQER